MQVTTEQRIKTLAFWSQVDPIGASSMARKEYDRLVQLDPGLSQESERRLFCLRTGANDDPQWAAPRLVREVLSSNDIARLHFQLLRSLPDQACASVCKELFPGLV